MVEEMRAANPAQHRGRQCFLIYSAARNHRHSLIFTQIHAWTTLPPLSWENWGIFGSEFWLFLFWSELTISWGKFGKNLKKGLIIPEKRLFLCNKWPNGGSDEFEGMAKWLLAPQMATGERKGQLPCPWLFFLAWPKVGDLKKRPRRHCAIDGRGEGDYAYCWGEGGKFIFALAECFLEIDEPSGKWRKCALLWGRFAIQMRRDKGDFMDLKVIVRNVKDKTINNYREKGFQIATWTGQIEGINNGGMVKWKWEPVKWSRAKPYNDKGSTQVILLLETIQFRILFLKCKNCLF